MHLEGTVIGFRTIGGKEIGRAGGSLVMIESASPPRELGVPREIESFRVFQDFQRDRIIISKNPEIGMKAGRILLRLLPRDHATEPAVMVAGFALP